jgi:hypothetical protein
MYTNIIAIPFRNREPHLDYFIMNTVPLIQQYMPNSKVVVIEQSEGKLFNRGKLLNIAFKEYENKTKYFFTHDVDINPTDNIIKTVYTREDIDIYRIKSSHKTSLGGIVKLKHNTVFDINGFPNNIWGWGIEDRALYYRCMIKNINITDNNTQSFNVLPHTSNAVTYMGNKLIISNIWGKDHIEKLNDIQQSELISFSGINTLDYNIIERKNIHDIVELIKVDI